MHMHRISLRYFDVQSSAALKRGQWHLKVRCVRLHIELRPLRVLRHAHTHLHIELRPLRVLRHAHTQTLKNINTLSHSLSLSLSLSLSRARSLSLSHGQLLKGLNASDASCGGAQRQYLYFCTSNASKLRTLAAATESPLQHLSVFVLLDQ
jgi:hypothetical protein